MTATILQREYTGDLARGGVELVLGDRGPDGIGPRYFVGLGDHLGPMSSSDYYSRADAETAFRADVLHWTRKREERT